MIAALALAVLAPGSLAPSLTCDREAIEPRSYRLATEAQALNVHRPRYRWWDGFDLGAHEFVLADLMEGAAGLAERARSLDSTNAMARSHLARLYLNLDEPERAEREWRAVMEAGIPVVWTATLYDVDARTYFAMVFDRRGFRIYRFDALAQRVDRRFYGIPEFPPAEDARFWEAMGGCIAAEARPEAEVPWSAVREIKAGNWVLWFKLDRPITVSSDRTNKRKTLREVKVALHGRTGELEIYERGRGEAPVIRGRGPAAYQDLVRRTLVRFVDSERRIALPPLSPGLGW